MTAANPWLEQGQQRFPWTVFYEAVAEKLLGYQSNRQCLAKGIHGISKAVGLKGYLDQDEDKKEFVLQDICPFTVMGALNRSVNKQRELANGIAGFLDVEVVVPRSFKGIPRFHNVRLGPFGYVHQRKYNDIDILWNLFFAAAKFAASDLSNKYRKEFIEAYDAATTVWGAKWDFTLGLFWAHPWDFPSLDRKSRRYIKACLRQETPFSNNQKEPCSAKEYLQLTNDLKEGFREDRWPVRSFPALACAALKQK